MHEQSSLSFLYTFFGIFLIKLTHHKEDGEEGNLTKWVMANILLRQIRIYYYSIRFFYHAQKISVFICCIGADKNVYLLKRRRRRREKAIREVYNNNNISKH